MSSVGAIFVPFPPKTETNLLHPLPPQSLNGPGILATYLSCPMYGTTDICNVVRCSTCCSKNMAQPVPVRIPGKCCNDWAEVPPILGCDLLRIQFF